MIPLDDVTLLLRGWAETKSRLRVVAQSRESAFSAFCTVYKAEGGRVAFWIGREGEKNAIDFLLLGCLFDFRDTPAGEGDLPIGATVESGIVGVRGDFNIAILLLTN
jgi:hypothetical protein